MTTWRAFIQKKYEGMYGGAVELDSLELALPQRSYFGFIVLTFIRDL